MPVSMEQWRASVGLNNAARSRASVKHCSDSVSPDHILEEFLLSLIDGSNFSTTQARGVCSKQRILKGLGVYLFVAFSITIICCLLHCAGDVETNPGPGIELISSNFAAIQNRLWEARTNWLMFGLQLKLHISSLQVLRSKYNDPDVCFTDMLVKWLDGCGGEISWKAVVSALIKPTVGFKSLAEKIVMEEEVFLDAPPIKVIISEGNPSNPSVEEKYRLSCTVSGAEDFSPTITYCWSHNGVVLVESSDSTLSFPSLSLSHGGQYTCQINLTSPFLKDTITATSNTHNIFLKGCPVTPSSHPMDSSSPPSTMEGPTPSLEEVSKDLKKTIQQQTQDLEDEFNGISIQTYDKIKEKDIDVDRFKARLVTLPFKYKEEHKEFFEQMSKELDGESTIICIWRKLSDYWNFMNYTLLENLIHNIGDRTLKQNMNSYLSSLKFFKRNTRLCDFAEHCPAVESRPSEADLKEFVLHLKLDWETCTLEQLEELKGHIIRKFLLPSFTLILKKVSPGSLIVTWLLPAQIASTLVQDLENTDNKGFFKEHKIESMTIDGKEYKYSSIPKYAAFLKDTYSTMEGKNLAAFKLAKIAKEEIDRSEMDSFTKSTIRGDKDDVIYEKYPMTEDEVALAMSETKRKKPRLVLIEGAPGVGKTTFSEQFCFKWSQGQCLNDRTLLVLLPLRDNRVKSAKSISDLFLHPQLQGAITQEVESSQGEGVVLWLEAWDELEQKMREESSIFLDLVHGRKLPKATIIITSRPWATKTIVKSTSIQVDQHIELVTTPTLELGRVLREERVHPDIRDKFLDHVNFYPAMKAAMYTPVTANIVTDVFQWSQEMESTPPTTVTQLYAAYTCKLLMQHYNAHGKQSWKIGSLEDLPPDVHQQLLALSKLAWEGIMKQQLTFSSADIGGVTLGLMESVKELYRGQDAELSYHFIHLMLQEFLAAYHITQLPLHTQQQLIREHVKVGHLSVVMKFYFGLSKSNTFTSEMVREQISDRGSAAAYHWMYEAGDTEAVSNLLAFGRSLYVESTYEWNPLDYYVFGHCIAHSRCKWNLNFRASLMGREGMEMFSKGMMNMPEREVPWEGDIETAAFSFNNLDFDSIEHFKNIPHPILKKLIALDLYANKLDNTCLNNLSKAIPFLTSLKELILTFNFSIGKGGAVKLIKTLSRNKTPLKKLHLDHTKIGEEDCASLTDLIANSELEELNIGFNSLSSNSVASIMKDLLQNSTIIKLDMCYSHFSEDNWKSLSSQLQRSECVLQDLIIAGCGITSEGAVQLVAGLATNKSLIKLVLCENPCEAALVGDALKTNSVLKDLDIARCNITSEGAELLADGLATNKSLTNLDLSWNPIGDFGAVLLADSLTTNKSLTNLNLSGDLIGDFGAASIGDALKINSVLMHLDITRCDITSEGAVSLADGLATNKSLTNLNLSGNPIEHIGAVLIADALATNKSLTNLNLSGNPIGDNGAVSIGDALKTNSVLMVIDISDCKITSQGCIQIAEGLSNNSTLQILQMSGNEIGVDGAKAISAMLEKNTSLQELHLCRDNSIEGVDMILSSLQSNTSLTTLSLPERYERPADPRVRWISKEA